MEATDLGEVAQPRVSPSPQTPYISAELLSPSYEANSRKFLIFLRIWNNDTTFYTCATRVYTTLPIILELWGQKFEIIITFKYLEPFYDNSEYLIEIFFSFFEVIYIKVLIYMAIFNILGDVSNKFNFKVCIN